MNTKFSKVLSVITAAALLFVTSSGSLKTITDAVEVHAAENVITGDVNSNGKIDILDLIHTKNAVINSAGSSNMDVTGDGFIDFKDARALQQYLLNQNDSFSLDIIKTLSAIDTSIVSKDQPIETSVTAEMAKKADELGDAVSVYNYLYNNMRSEFYYGSRKGAIGAFEQGSGNDADLSSLLIAMLRYLGYEANYVIANVGFTEQQILKWTNADSVHIANSILASQNRISSIMESGKEKYYCYQYFYVQVIDSGKKYNLDICFKEYAKQKTIYDDLYKCNNSKNILTSQDFSALNNDILRSDNITSQLSGQGYIYSQKIVNKNITALSENKIYSYISDEKSFKSISEDYSDIISIGFNDNNLETYKSAELYKKKITVSYKVSQNSKDNAEWLSAGAPLDTSTIFNLPSSVFGQPFSVVAELKIDGKSVVKTSEHNIGTEQNFIVSIKTGGETKKYVEKLTAGEMCSVVLDMGHISANELSESYIKSLENTSAVNNKYKLTEAFVNESKNNSLSENNIYTSEYFGELLRLTGLMYFAQVDITSHALAEKERVYNESLLRMSFVGYKPTAWNKTSPYETVNQEDGILRTGKFYIDAQANNTVDFSLSNDNCSLQSFNLERGLISSELESTVLKQIFNVEALSTASILNYANENSIPIVTLSASSEHTISEITADADDIKRIKDAIDNGCTVITPTSKVKIGTWNGLGYIVIKGSSQQYLISGGYYGGTTIDPVPLYYTLGVALDIALIAEGMSAMIGILATMSTLALGPVGLMVLMTVSVTFIAIDILKQSYNLYEYEVEGNIEAGYEIWLSTLTNGGLTLVTGCGAIAGNRLGSVITESRLGSIYGKSVVNNLESYGFTVNEVNSVIKKFKSFGFSESTIDILLKDAKCMYLEDDILKVIGKNSDSQNILVDLVLKNNDEFKSLVIDVYNKEGAAGLQSLISTFGDSYLVWYRISGTAENMDSTFIPATFQIRLKENYINPKTNTNVLWVNANGTKHLQQYVGRFGKESWSIKLRSQLMLDSFAKALDEAVNEIITKPLRRYEDLNFGGWQFGIDTESGVVFHALKIFE